MAEKRVIQLEFNELSPVLMKKFISQGHLPNFKKLYEGSQSFITDANEEGFRLNPWIQWVTVHTGKSVDEHGVFRLNQINDYKGNFIWDELSDKGKKSFICGSMNVKHQPNLNGLFLPDPWATDATPYPANKFDDYFRFVSQSVKEHSNSESISAGKFAKFMAKNGLSLKTFKKITYQLIAEKVKRGLFWKRALVLDWLQFDVFKHHYLNEKPAFATFFSNSTAHYQHHYWREMEPEKFGENPDEMDPGKNNAILMGYKNADEILHEVFKLADADTVICFITALSQQPYLENQRYYYHIASKDVFYQQFNIDHNVKYKPVMAEQFHLECGSEQEAIALMAHLENYEMESNQYFHVGSNRVFHLSQKGNHVHVQNRCTKLVEEGAVIKDKRNGESSDFYTSFIKMADLKSGTHHPHGLFWVYDKTQEPKGYEQPIPLEQSYQIIYDLMN